MSERAKSPVLILVVLVFFALALAGGIYYLLQKERGKNLNLQAELAEVRGKQMVTEAKLEESQKTAADLEQKLNDARSEIAALRRQLEQENTDKKQALSNASQLQTELNKQKELRVSLEEKYRQAQEETARIQSQLTELNNRKAELENRIKELEAKSEQIQQQAQAQEEQGVDLGTVTVEGETEEPAAALGEDAAVAPDEPSPIRSVSGIEGKVLVVNREYNFAVINLGSRDGVRIGDIFTVYRANKKKVGEIRIERIHDSMSAGTFLSAQMKNKVNEGDRVAPSAR